VRIDFIITFLSDNMNKTIHLILYTSKSGEGRDDWESNRI